MRRLGSEACTDARRAGGRRLALWAAMSLAALAAGPAPAAEPPQLTTQQMRALSPKDADRIIREDLLSVLQPVGQLDQDHRRLLRNVGLTTRAFNTDYEGLCRRDVVRLRYAPVDGAGPYPDGPIRPYSVEARAQFALRHAPPLVRRRLEPGQVWGADCERMGDDAAVHWFEAPGDPDAAQAVNLLEATLARVRAGTLTPCPPDNGGCSSLSSMKAEKLQDVYRVRSCTPESGGAVCYQYYLPGSLVTVVARDGGAAADVSADDVVSVKEETLIDDE